MGSTEVLLARKDWKRALGEAVDALGDRVRAALDRLAPQPELVPIPVRPVRPQRPGRRDERQ